jgi:hypothetical protein
MEPEQKNIQSTDDEEKYELIFRNGALANLKKLANNLGVPEENLKEVVNKGIKVLTLIKSVDTKTIILETKQGEKFTLDVEKI